MHGSAAALTFRFAGPKVAMDQKGGCGILLHIPQTILAANSYKPADCHLWVKGRSAATVGTRPVFHQLRKNRHAPDDGSKRHRVATAMMAVMTGWFASIVFRRVTRIPEATRTERRCWSTRTPAPLLPLPPLSPPPIPQLYPPPPRF